MMRFFVDEIRQPIVLRGEHFRHLAVLRVRIGDELTLCCGDGYDYICRIESMDKEQARLRLTERRESEGEASISVTLFFSVLKGDKNEWVVQKATELGVAEIVPLITRYVQAHDRAPKTERLQKIAREAAQQCGRGRIPVVRSAISFAELLPRLSSFDEVIFPYEKASEPSLRAYLRARADKTVRRAAVIVGSEGGFADEEASALQDKGVVPVTLGKRILRAETANVAVLSALFYEWGQWE